MESPSAALRWLESLTKQPPSTPDATLCDYLRDGRVLCMLANALSETNEVRVRSPDRFRTYHALESVSLFLRWARDRASIGDNAMFTSAQLIDEQDEVAVLACLRALEAKYRSKSGGVVPATIADTTVKPDVVPPTKTVPPSTPSVVKAPVESTKSHVSTSSTTPTTLSSSPAKESTVNVVERIQQIDPTPVQSERASPRRSPPPKQSSPIPRATPSPAVDEPLTPTPPSQPSPTAPTTTSPKASVLIKSKSKLASFLASTPATATPATIHKAPPQPLSRLASLSSASDVSVEGSRVEQVPSTTLALVVDPIPPSNGATPVPVAAADAAADTTTTASPPPPRQRNKIASAYLAAIENSTPSPPSPPSPRRAPSPKRVSSPKSAASPPTEPKTPSKLQAFTSGGSFTFASTSVVDVRPDTSVDAPEPSISPKATVATSFQAYEPLATTASPRSVSSDIVLTIPSLSEAGFDFAWCRQSNAVVIRLHQEPMWPHLTLSSINGVQLTKNGRLSLAEWRRTFQELSGPFECRFHPSS